MTLVMNSCEFTEEIGYNERSARVLVTPTRPSPHVTVRSSERMADSQFTSEPLDKNGRPIGGRRGKSVRERFDASVPDRGDGCWIWKGSLNAYGYGRMSIGTPPNQRNAMAHRVSWEMHFGPIGDGLYVCHRCDNPPCVNPAHLFLGTQFDNMGDAGRKGRLPQQKYAGFCAGSRNGRSKLTEAQAKEIRDSWPAISQRSLATKFGVSRALVRHIIAGGNWTHV